MDRPEEDVEAKWQHIRKYRFSTSPPPEDWPVGVRPISLNGSALFGIDGKNEIYWDGEKLITERRLATFERWLASVGLFVATIGVAATVVQAWAAIQSMPKPRLGVAASRVLQRRSRGHFSCGSSGQTAGQAQ